MDNENKPNKIHKIKNILGIIKELLLIVLCITFIVFIVKGILIKSSNTVTSKQQDICKPVLYLYSDKQEKVQVKLNFKNDKISYPLYDNDKGWEVITNADGTLTNTKDNKNYSYLFWESMDSGEKYDLSKGFIVKGEYTQEFLQSTLSKMGLQPREYNEFIVYWLPKMINNKYNLIHFASKDEYNNIYPLEVSPKPNSSLRVFMVFKPLDNPVKVTNQNIEPFERKGLTLLEWGGREIK